MTDQRAPADRGAVPQSPRFMRGVQLFKVLAFAFVVGAIFGAYRGIDNVPSLRTAHAAGFGQTTLTRTGGTTVTVQTGRAGTIALVTPYGTGSSNKTPATTIFATESVATVCTNIAGLSFTLQSGGAACVGASDRVYWEPQGTGTRIHADGSFIDVTASAAVVAAAIAAVP